MVKFLIIRFSSIGDIVLTTPVIRCLKEQVEGAEIYYLTKKQFTPVLQANPYITKIFTLKSGLSHLLSELREEGFDYIIDLHKNLRSYRVKRAIRHISFSVDKVNFQKWMMVNFKRNRLPGVHIVDRYMNTLQSFSVKNDHKGLDYFIPEEELNAHDKWLPQKFTNYMTCVVGGGHNTKQIPVGKLCYLLKKLTKYSIVLLGGPEDITKADQLVEELQSDKVFSLVGKLSINQSAALIKKASLIITPDTGMMHIASAFKKNIISVWGNTIPEFGMYPYKAGGKSKIFEVKELSCRPCSKIGFKKCPKKHFNCMAMQNYEAMAQHVNELMQGN